PARQRQRAGARGRRAAGSRPAGDARARGDGRWHARRRAGRRGRFRGGRGAAAVSIRVVVADDQEVVRAGFSALLDTQPDLEMVGTGSEGAEAVRVCAEQRASVVVMDVRMPVMDGIEATRALAGGPRVLMLTTFDLDEYVYDALSAGASGFLLKDVTAERLFDAVRVVAAGDALLAPAVTRRLIGEFARLRP